MRRVTLYVCTSALTFLVGFTTALVLERPAAPTFKAASPNVLSAELVLFDTRSQPRSFKFESIDNPGSSITALDEKTGEVYCLQAGGRRTRIGD